MMIQEVSGMRLPEGYGFFCVGDVYVLADQASGEVAVFSEGYDPAHVEDAAWEDRLRDANAEPEDVAAALDALLLEAGFSRERVAYWQERFDRAVFWANFEALECFEAASLEEWDDEPEDGEEDLEAPCVYVSKEWRGSRTFRLDGLVSRLAGVLSGRGVPGRGVPGRINPGHTGFRLW